MSFPVRAFVVAVVATLLPVMLAVVLDDASAAPREPEARRLTVASPPVASPAQPVPSYPKPFRPVWGPVFNNPMGGVGAQRRILNYVVKVVDGVPRGGTIRVSMYVFNDRAVWNALNRALDRRVRVRIVLDGHDSPPPADEMRERIGSDPDAPSYLVDCEKSCRGETGVNHQKFFMFSSSAGVRHVVLVSSGNMTGGNVDEEWNDLFSVAGSKPVYDSFDGVFEQLKLDRPVARPYVEAEQRTFSQGFYPARGVDSGGRDPWLDYLDDVSCRGALRGGLGGRTRIRVSMSAMHGDRGRTGARRLVALAGDGCEVKVIFGASSGEGVRTILTKGGVSWRLSSHRGLRSHQKMLLINGKIGTDAMATRVYTGSLNWTDSAVNRDEVVLGVKGERSMKLYAQNWYYMWQHG